MVEKIPEDHLSSFFQAEMAVENEDKGWTFDAFDSGTQRKLVVVPFLPSAFIFLGAAGWMYLAILAI